MHFQCTAQRAASCAGRSLHHGQRVNLRVEPAPPGTGFVFIREDLPGRPEIPVRPENVVGTRMATTLGVPGAHVGTVEHLLAAALGLGYDNLRFFVDADELPAVDGSARPFVRLLRRAGRRIQRQPRRLLEILEPVEVQSGRSRARLSPAQPGEGFSLHCEIEFAHPSIGRQQIQLTLDNDTFTSGLAPARTFGFLEQVEALHASGLGRGGSLENCVVLDDAGVMNEGGLRFPDEFVRHKALDALGDLALLGHPIRGHFYSAAGGHQLNQQLVQALMARPSAWRLSATDGAPVAEFDAA